jgi:hypothetical protein
MRARRCGRAPAATCSRRPSRQELLQAFRMAVAGGNYLHPRLGALMATGEETAADERRAVRARARGRAADRRGYTNPEIAEQLQVAERTVKTYRARAIEKLGFSSRAEITAYVRRLGLASRRRLTLDSTPASLPTGAGPRGPASGERHGQAHDGPRRAPARARARRPRARRARACPTSRTRPPGRRRAARGAPRRGAPAVVGHRRVHHAVALGDAHDRLVACAWRLTFVSASCTTR